MKLSFLGAAKTVTGSCYLIETISCKFLVDCGMFQGKASEDDLNEQDFPFNPSELDFMLLTHSHIDHSGRIPKLYKNGFKGRVFTTKATVDLCSIMLPDSGHIQEMENEWTNRKRQRAGKNPIPPLYTYQDALDCISLFKGVSYGEPVKVNNDIRVKFNDAGHILGSSIIELWVTENGEETKLVFSGDLGNKNIPILRDPSIIESADYLVIESTYGNRLHQSSGDKVDRFVDIINETVEKGGNIIIPSFAVGRTQEIIYDLHKNRDKYKDKISKLFSIPVYVDSPLAISATEVFRKNLDCYDEEARAYIENGDNPLDFPGLKFTITSDESKALNEKTESMIIISSSGMCDAGRIKHHLKHNLWRPESTILFVGYQAVGTLGRRLVEGAKKVKLFGEEITVNARIEMLESFSGHADRDGLLGWISRFNTKPKKIFLVHGEEEVMNEFSESIKNSCGIETLIPSRGDTYEVTRAAILKDAEKHGEVIDFRKLAVIELLEKLREEFVTLSETMKNEINQIKNNGEIDELRVKLKNLEKIITNLL